MGVSRSVGSNGSGPIKIGNSMSVRLPSPLALLANFFGTTAVLFVARWVDIAVMPSGMGSWAMYIYIINKYMYLPFNSVS